MRVLPPWLTVLVVLVVLGLLGYSVIVFGPEGYPITLMLGGLLGGYAGLNQVLKSKNKDGDQ